MDKLAFKKKVIEAGRAEHQSVIDDYRAQIERLRSETDPGGDQMDDQQKAFNNEINVQIDVLAGQLNFALEEMNLLNRMTVEPPLHDSVRLGSVVVTDQRTFYVSVSIEDFEAEGQKLFGLSTKTPLYAEMKEKKAGDHFTFGKFSYKIRDVY